MKSRKQWVHVVGSLALVFLVAAAVGPVLQAQTCYCDVGGGCTFVAKCGGSCESHESGGQCEITYEGEPCEMSVDCIG
jgi:hypothetical protein